MRKLLLTLTALLLIPASAGAWYVNAKTSPATGQGTISPAGSVSYPQGISTEYIVSQAPGFGVSRVTLDGVKLTPNANGIYVVPYLPGKAWRYIVAYFATGTVNITTQITAGSGAIREDTNETLSNIPLGSDRQLLVIPNPGYLIDSVTAAGAAITDNGDGSRTVTYSNLQSSSNVLASFSLLPLVTASAGGDVTANGADAEFAATLYGSATSNQGAIAYAWSGPGLVFGTPNAAGTTVYSATPGAYAATLTVTSGGIVKQDSAMVTVLDRLEYLETICTGCHSLNTPQVVSDYDASGHKTGRIVCQDCHTSEPHTDVKPSCFDCHSPNNSRGLPWPPTTGHNAYTETNQCYNCHDPHKASGGNCDSCHDCPPPTASHQKHFGGNLTNAGYGDTRIGKDFKPDTTSYIMSCGNCHPIDPAKHLDGQVQVELYNPLAPAGSLKALNPSTAGYLADTMVFTDGRGYPYSNGTCSNVYCHSYNDWTTSAAIPQGDPDWENKVVTTRIYRTVTWGGAALTCSGCHANPPTSSYPANEGAGNSHSWIDPYGYENLHNYNHSWEPVSCSYCHNGTVTQQNTYTRNSMDVSTLSDVPISNNSNHVNGVYDVSFDKQNTFVYKASSGDVAMDLVTAIYDPDSKNCSNVACHINETSVKWGKPFRWYTDECSPCHGY